MASSNERLLGKNKVSPETGTSLAQAVGTQFAALQQEDARCLRAVPGLGSWPPHCA